MEAARSGEFRRVRRVLAMWGVGEGGSVVSILGGCGVVCDCD